MIPLKDEKITLLKTDFFDKPMRFACEKQIRNTDMWKKFADQFRYHTDNDNGWRGEFWGKCMRGACLIYDFYRESDICDIIENTVCDIISCADDNGCISSYPEDKQFNGWDIWCRKYIMLGLIYYLEFVCSDEDKRKTVINALCRHADCIISAVGDGEGKKRIYDCTTHWQGINSSSVLEPFAVLYRLTGKKDYFDFCTYIIKSGMASGFDLYETAKEGKLYPYQYPVTKAYEMMSCFEGILEYYTITKEPEYLSTVIDFAHKIAKSDVTVIGSCGCTHELFDNSSSRQTFTGYNDIMQETCVTVTWMKLCGKLLALTGDSFYADLMEQSYYNAYLGAHNYADNKSLGGLPYDSYSPLLPNVRSQKTGGRMVIDKDGGIYGCCAAIASLGGAMFVDSAAWLDGDRLVIRFYDSMKIKASMPSGNVGIDIVTDYPKDGVIKITSDAPVKLCLRIPAYCTRFKVSAPYEFDGGYIYTKCDGNLTLRLEEDIKINRAPGFGGDGASYGYAYVTRGPVLLGLDENISDKGMDSPVQFTGTFTDDETSYHHTVCVSAETDGGRVKMIDYRSCGVVWDDKKRISAFIKVK